MHSSTLIAACVALVGLAPGATTAMVAPAGRTTATMIALLAMSSQGMGRVAKPAKTTAAADKAQTPPDTTAAPDDDGGGGGGGPPDGDDDGAGDDDDASETLVDVVVATKSLSTLLSLVKKADLVDTLSGDGPFTVFAPSNDAFDKLDKATLKAVNDDADLLKKVLLYHVLASKVLSTDLEVDTTTVATANDLTLFVTKSAAGVVTIQNNDRTITATVTLADVGADNGVAHVIDTVLVPGEEPTTTNDDGVVYPCDKDCFNGGVCVLVQSESNSGDVDAPYDTAVCQCPTPTDGVCFWGETCMTKETGCAADTQSCNRVNKLGRGQTAAEEVCSASAEPSTGGSTSPSNGKEKSGGAGGAIAAVLIILVLIAIVALMFVKKAGPFAGKVPQQTQSFSNPMYDTAESLDRAKTAAPEDAANDAEQSENGAGYMDVPATDAPVYAELNDDGQSENGAGYMDVPASSETEIGAGGASGYMDIAGSEPSTMGEPSDGGSSAYAYLDDDGEVGSDEEV